MVKSDVIKAKLTPTVSDTINGVEAAAPSMAKPCEPPQQVLKNSDTDERADFVRLWQRVPPHLHAINFDFEKERWTAADTDGEIYCVVMSTVFTAQHGVRTRYS